MMTLTENGALRDGGEPRPPGIRTMLLSGILGLMFLMTIGGAGGAMVAIIRGKAEGPAGPILVIVFLMAAAVCAWGLARLKPWDDGGEPVAGRIRKSRHLLLASGALGGIIGGALALSAMQNGDPFGAFSNSPVSPAIAIPVLAVWLLVVPLISWQWHRNVDEHELRAYQAAGIYGLYFYAFAAPACWLASRAGLIPAVDPMLIYAAVFAVWGFGWMWRRYR